jgi:hypothetical protein
MKSRFFFLFLVTAIAAGCTTTKTSRIEAARLSAKVQNYKSMQQQRIQSLNQGYQKTYNQLMKELEDVYNFQVDQTLDLVAMQVSERILSQWENETLPSQFRGTFAQTMEDNLKQIASVDVALQQARSTYAASYQDAVLQLKKLDDAKSDLDALAATPSQTKEMTALLQALYTAYQTTQKERSETNTQPITITQPVNK